MDTKFLTIDSSVFVASFVKEEICYEVSREFFRLFFAMGNVRSVMPVTVFLEVVNVLHNSGYTKSKLENVIQKLEVELFAWVTLDTYYVNRLQDLILGFKLKTSDAIIASTVNFYDSLLISWDNRLIREIRKSGLEAFTPAEYLRKISQ